MAHLITIANTALPSAALADIPEDRRDRGIGGRR